MGKDLLIVESPSKARTINKYLGKDYEVLASVGHIRDLPKKKFGVNIENGFEPKYVTVRGKGKVIKKLKQAAKKADEVYLAPDPDREGEAIAWHIAQVLKKNPEKVHRVLFNEITKSGVKRGLKEPREINDNLVNAQQARRILDRIVGYSVSPFLWKTLYRGLSAGRVQSVAARLICEREDEIEAFVPEEYWEMFANYITESDEKFQAKGVKFEGSKLKISNADEAKKHADAIQSADHIVEKVKVKNRKKSPAPPFTTSTLQQTATRFYHYSPKQTMSIAQKLYEGIELKGEPVGLITYMRTDSLRISKEAINSSRKHIDEEYGDKYLPKKPRYYKQSGKNVQDAHECIRPTNLNLPPEKVAKQLSKRQLKIYSLIWKRFVACQMTPAIYKRKTIEIKADKYLFRARGENEIFDGYLKAYRKGRSKKKSKNKKKVPEQISEKENLELKKLDKEQKFTNPPPRYTEGTLVKQLDKLGIGRPSTYASIVSTIRGRNYIIKEKGRLKPTELGRTVNEILVNQMPKIFNVKFTNQMEEDLDQIESDQRDWKEVMEEFYGPFKKSLDQAEAKKDEIKKGLEEDAGEKCDKCGAPMIIKWGRNGKFKACSNFPKCKNTKPLTPPDAKGQTRQCPECGADMELKEGRYGKFWACTRYPDCKGTLPYTIGIDCPEEDCDGEITEKKTRRGKTFWGCSNYPDCEFSSWNKPVDRKCENCGYGVLLEGKKNLYCPKCKAKYKKEED